MDSRQSIEDEIDLRALLEMLWRRRLIILAVTVVVALATAGVSMFVLPPVYESHAQILLSFDSAPVYATAEAAARFLRGNSFLEPTARASGIQGTGPLVRATPVRDTQVIDLRIRYSDRERLQVFTDVLIREFMRRSSQRIEARRRDAERRLGAIDAQLREIERTAELTRQTLERIASGAPGDVTSWLARSVVLNLLGTSEGLYSGLLSAQRDLRNEILALEAPTLIQDPYIPPEPVSPRPARNISVAVALGLVAGIIVAFALEAFQSRSVVGVTAQSASVSSPPVR